MKNMCERWFLRTRHLWTLNLTQVEMIWPFFRLHWSVLTKHLTIFPISTLWNCHVKIIQNLINKWTINCDFHFDIKLLVMWPNCSKTMQNCTVASECWIYDLKIRVWKYRLPFASGNISDFYYMCLIVGPRI